MRKERLIEKMVFEKIRTSFQEIEKDLQQFSNEEIDLLIQISLDEFFKILRGVQSKKRREEVR